MGGMHRCSISRLDEAGLKTCPAACFVPAESEPAATRGSPRGTGGEVGAAALKCNFAHLVPQPLTRRLAPASPEGEATWFLSPLGEG